MNDKKISYFFKLLILIGILLPIFTNAYATLINTTNLGKLDQTVNSLKLKIEKIEQLNKENENEIKYQ